MNESNINKQEEITKKQMSIDSEQTKKQDSRVMNFFNQEFLERKIDFKPKKALQDNRKLDPSLKQILKNSKTFDHLLDIERKLDEKMFKTRLNIQEKLIIPTPKLKALLRTHIFSYLTKSPTDEMFTDEIGSIEGIWTLRLQGKVMPVLDTQPGGFYRKFSYFFHKIQIKFDKENKEHYQDIEWTRSGNADIDGFEIKRPTASFHPLKLKMIFYLNLHMLEYKVSDSLAAVIGIKQDTRPRILFHIWQYIKINNLQDKEHPNLIINNREFQQIFNCDKMDVVSLTFRLTDHIKPPDPIEIDFVIKPVDDWTECQKLTDIIVNIDDPHFSDISNFLSNAESDSILFPKSMYYIKTEGQKGESQTYAESFYNEISENDRNITDLMEKLKKHKYKYDFYDSFGKDPIKFINNFLLQQNSLLKIMNEESSILDARWDYNSAQYYKDYEEILREYVETYLNKHQK